jgi:hypothetical protein
MFRGSFCGKIFLRVRSIYAESRFTNSGYFAARDAFFAQTKEIG